MEKKKNKKTPLEFLCAYILKYKLQSDCLKSGNTIFLLFLIVKFLLDIKKKGSDGPKYNEYLIPGVNIC